MNAFQVSARCLVIVMALFCVTVVSGAEKLSIFILAGQSNMVGHARAHTIATLYASDSPRDKELLNLVINNDGLSRDVIEAQLKQARTIDSLTGGISNSKIKALEEGAEKAELEKKVAALKDDHQA